MSVPRYSFDVEYDSEGLKLKGTAKGDLSCACCGQVTGDKLIVLPPMFSEAPINDIRMFIPTMHRECLGLYLCRLLKVDAP